MSTSPNERKLTSGEKNLLNRFFNCTMSLEMVRVYTTAHPSVSQSSTRAHSAGNNIYFPQRHRYYDDFSKLPVWKLAVFIHEMAHIWQYQTGRRATLPVNRTIREYESYLDQIKVSRTGVSLDTYLKNRNANGRHRQTLGGVSAALNTNPMKFDAEPAIRVNTTLAGGQQRTVTVASGAPSMTLAEYMASGHDFTENEIRASWSRNSDYDYMPIDWKTADFDALNDEAQAQMITDYFLIKNEASPRTVNTHIYASGKDPLPLVVYELIVPFAKAACR
ncbi:hypothetical protein [Yoonia maritima]|uniref:hypothetical protein n=1 Tax=Yoonia maritima TaxID=1435347 RepID=UPI0013A66842|nr:hypothetical protein [Yoonia maritima]